MSKKAIEIQFNWIFVLIAGTAILIFFTVLVVKQKNLSESSTKAVVLKSMESIISGASTTIDTTKIENLPNINIEIGCNKISIGNLQKQYQNLILFGPKLVKGKGFVWQTSAFSMPYRSTNLLYLTSPQLKYIITGINDLVKEVNKSMPVYLDKELYASYQTALQIKDSNNYKIRFLIFDSINLVGNSVPLAVAKMKDEEVSALKIEGDAEKGTLEFYQKKGNSWNLLGTSAYIGKSALLGAVYADNLEAYDCNMQNTFGRLKLVTDVYYERTKKLRDTVQRQECRQIYNNALNQINSIKSLSSSFRPENVNNMVSTSKLLSVQNKEAQKFSCPLIY